MTLWRTDWLFPGNPVSGSNPLSGREGDPEYIHICDGGGGWGVGKQSRCASETSGFFLEPWGKMSGRVALAAGLGGSEIVSACLKPPPLILSER